MSGEVAAALIGGSVALVVSVVSGIIAYVVSERRLRSELQLEDAAETAVSNLLSRGWDLRSFEVIKHHIRGFEDDDLRQILVRSGAIAFSDPRGREIWGLLSKNLEKLATRDALEAAGLEFDDISGHNQYKAIPEAARAENT